MVDLSQFCICPDRNLREVMDCINRNAKGIALVVEDNGRLRYTVTDGDLRRAVLEGLSLDMSVEAWAKRRVEHGNLHPTTAMVGTSLFELRLLMKKKGLLHVPLTDGDGRVVDLVLLSELIEAEPALTAVLMAGGSGTRLRPLTSDLPKPMLPIGDRPLMEHIVNQLRDAGIRQVSITTHYKPEPIIQHFGNGHQFGVEINYVNEERPLGTAGSLSLLPPWSSTLLVMNGDIFTRLNYNSMLAFHRENHAAMTVGVRQYAFQIPYGVVETIGVDIQRLSEKPTLQFFVNGGVYLLEPGVRRMIGQNQKIDMTDLISRLLAENQRVVSFPISEYWLDIGQPADYAQAQTDYKEEIPG